MEIQEILTVECSCGNVFEPESLEVDRTGDRFALCPKCQHRIPVIEEF